MQKETEEITVSQRTRTDERLLEYEYEKQKLRRLDIPWSEFQERLKELTERFDL